MRLIAAFCLLLPLAAVAAQGAPPPIDDEALVALIEERCEVLRGNGELLGLPQLRAGAEANRPHPLELPPLRTTALKAPDLHDALRPSLLTVGHYYRCEGCDAWHFSGASGFPLTADGVVVTSWHMLLDDEWVPDALLVAADLQGNVFPVQKLLCHDPRSDVCVVQVDAKGLVPLPLRAGVRTGESIWCLSNPDHQFAVFTGGAVARHYLLRDAPGGEEGEMAAGGAPAAAALPPVPFLHVTCAFAGGSSGAPVVDECGNVVGLAQSTSTIVHDFEAEQPDVQMVLRTASPAAALLALVRPKR